MGGGRGGAVHDSIVGQASSVTVEPRSGGILCACGFRVDEEWGAGVSCAAPLLSMLSNNYNCDVNCCGSNEAHDEPNT